MTPRRRRRPTRIPDGIYRWDSLRGSRGERDNGNESLRPTTSRTTRGVVDVRQHREALLGCNAAPVPPRYADRCSTRPNCSSACGRASGAIAV
jgi:hypothetical protein